MDIAGTLNKVKQQRGMWGTNLCAAIADVTMTGSGTGTGTSSRFGFGGSFLQKPSMSAGQVVCTDTSGNAVLFKVAVNSWLVDPSTDGICGAIVNVSPLTQVTVSGTITSAIDIAAYTANLCLQFIGNGVPSNVTDLAACATISP